MSWEIKKGPSLDSLLENEDEDLNFFACRFGWVAPAVGPSWGLTANRQGLRTSSDTRTLGRRSLKFFPFGSLLSQSSTASQLRRVRHRPTDLKNHGREGCNSTESLRHRKRDAKQRWGERTMAMVSPNCWRCLLRPSVASTTTTTAAAAATTTIISPTIAATPSMTHHFSTTAPSHATAAPRPGTGMHQRLGKRMTMTKFKKNRDFGRSRSPQIGERKAWRKRIVLSNNNAIRVDGLKTMDVDNLALPESAGEVFKIPAPTIDQLRSSEAFKSSQTWNLFHSPHALVRPETVAVCGKMLEAADQGKTARMVVAGDRGAGKSMVLVQAMVNAFLHKWVVIHIPEGTFISKPRPASIDT